jgi:hypothetical protein
LNATLMAKILLAGFVILAAAILLNLLANWLGWHTWYSFLNILAEQGFRSALQAMSWFDFLFLLFFYPFLLGLCAYAFFKLLGG